MKKPFKETKVGKFLLDKLPGFVAGTLPDKGVLGIVKNLIDNEPDLYTRGQGSNASRACAGI